jgi:hypothetical protein
MTTISAESACDVMRTILTPMTLAVVLVACGDDSNPGAMGPGTSISGANTGASPSGGGMSNAGASGGTAAGTQGGVAAGASMGSAGASGGGGTIGIGNASGTGSASGVAGSGPGAGPAMPGASAGGAGAGTGGTMMAGAGGTGAMTGGGTGNAGACTRELLKSTVDTYFKALAAHDPAMLPLAAGAKFTENGKAQELGAAGLWKTAGMLKHVHSALDTETCQAASQAVVPDGTMDIPVALRIKLQDQKLTEIETIAVRPGDYTALGSPFPSNTGALAASAMSVKWEEPVTTGRNTRAEITGWIDKYFRMFPRGVCNTASNCKRIENGGGNFNCSLGASCASGQPGPSDNALKTRLLLADVETGVGVGFTMFMGNTDMHMYKMYGGQIYCVSAILGRADASGWD